MSEHDLNELAKLLKKSIFSTGIKWFLAITATIISTVIVTTLSMVFSANYGTKQNTKDIIELKSEFDRKVDQAVFKQYLQENTSDHYDIKEEIKGLKDGQIVIQSDIKQLLRRK
ncbi:MAG: hypothetical protein M0P47_09525 [Bacteroidales bacterium]|nr:hypothetical protein [Bacteroidales bacterium]